MCIQHAQFMIRHALCDLALLHTYIQMIDDIFFQFFHGLHSSVDKKNPFLLFTKYFYKLITSSLRSDTDVMAPRAPLFPYQNTYSEKVWGLDLQMCVYVCVCVCLCVCVLYGFW